MAQINVEDCVTRIPNRFELVMMTSRRVRGLVDRNVNDLGKTYGDDAEGVSDAMDDPNNRFYD
jgi:DNA-directed RNA polymerase omega subunit